MNRNKKLWKILEEILMGLIAITCLVFLVSFLPIKNNYKLLVVMSGSMQPTVKTGSLIFVQPIQSYKVGEIVTFYPADATTKKNTITHRIVDSSQKDSGVVFTTKGDANQTPDPQPLAENKIVGKYLGGIPYLGYLVSFIKTLPGLILIIIIPATIIIYEETRKIHHETKKIIHHRRKRKNEANDPTAEIKKVMNKKGAKSAKTA